MSKGKKLKEEVMLFLIRGRSNLEGSLKNWCLKRGLEGSRKTEI